MTTIKRLIERIEERLLLVSGIDVQIHAEDALVEYLRSRYILCVDQFWLNAYSPVIITELNGTTGEVIIDLSDKILSYTDIEGVFIENQEAPLPQLQPSTNPLHIRGRCIAPSGNAASVFKVYPNDYVSKVAIRYKMPLTDEMWDAQDDQTDIPYDTEALILGTVADFAGKDDPEEGKSWEAKFRARVAQLRKKEMQLPISKDRMTHGTIEDRWTVWP